MLCRCAYPAGAGNPGWPGQHPRQEIELHGRKTDPVEPVLRRMGSLGCPGVIPAKKAGFFDFFSILPHIFTLKSHLPNHYLPIYVYMSTGAQNTEYFSGGIPP